MKNQTGLFAFTGFRPARPGDGEGIGEGKSGSSSAFPSHQKATRHLATTPGLSGIRRLAPLPHPPCSAAGTEEQKPYR